MEYSSSSTHWRSCQQHVAEKMRVRCCMQVPILKAHLKGKWIGGEEWRAGCKKRSELISDYRSEHRIWC